MQITDSVSAQSDHIEAEPQHRLWLDDVVSWRRSIRILVRKMTELQQSLLSWDAELDSLVDDIRRHEALTQSCQTAEANPTDTAAVELDRLHREAESSRRHCKKRRDRLEEEFHTLIDAHRSALETTAPRAS